MRTPFFLALFALSALLSACASSDAEQKPDPAPVESAAPAPDTSACDNARAAARAAWSTHFNRVQELAPEDRDAMADEHASLPESELAGIEQSASEGGDEVQLGAIEATRAANAACG
jgi:hypothetical protein